MSVATEEAQVRQFFGYGEDVGAIAATLEEGDDRRARLLGVAQRAIADAGPVRVSIAARLLGLSEPTIRGWTEAGVLLSRGDGGSLRLDPTRLYDVMALVQALRAAGRTRGLLDAVWHRLTDQALLETDELEESVAQMRRAEGRVLHEK